MDEQTVARDLAFLLGKDNAAPISELSVLTVASLAAEARAAAVKTGARDVPFVVSTLATVLQPGASIEEILRMYTDDDLSFFGLVGAEGLGNGVVRSSQPFLVPLVMNAHFCLAYYPEGVAAHQVWIMDSLEHRRPDVNEASKSTIELYHAIFCRRLGVDAARLDICVPEGVSRQGDAACVALLREAGVPAGLQTCGLFSVVFCLAILAEPDPARWNESTFVLNALLCTHAMVLVQVVQLALSIKSSYDNNQPAELADDEETTLTAISLVERVALTALAEEEIGTTTATAAAGEEETTTTSYALEGTAATAYSEGLVEAAPSQGNSGPIAEDGYCTGSAALFQLRCLEAARSGVWPFEYRPKVVSGQLPVHISEALSFVKRFWASLFVGDHFSTMRLLSSDVLLERPDLARGWPRYFMTVHHMTPAQFTPLHVVVVASGTVLRVGDRPVALPFHEAFVVRKQARAGCLIAWNRLRFLDLSPRRPVGPASLHIKVEGGIVSGPQVVQALQAFGKVADCRVIAGHTCQFAQVEMEDAASASRAIAARRVPVRPGCTLLVKAQRRNEPRPKANGQARRRKRPPVPRTVPT